MTSSTALRLNRDVDVEFQFHFAVYKTHSFVLHMLKGVHVQSLKFRVVLSVALFLVQWPMAMSCAMAMSNDLVGLHLRGANGRRWRGKVSFPQLLGV